MSRELAALPKAHLHVHLESAIRPVTLAALGGGLELPGAFTGFAAFADYNAAVRACLRTPADFERIAYEFCEDSAVDGVRYADETATREDALSVAALDDRLAAARPAALEPA